MKKQLLLISLVFAMFTALGQDVTTAEPVDNTSATTEKESTYCPHRITIHLGGAYTNNIYKRFPNELAQQKYAWSGVLELGYAYFFHEHWGIGLGVGLSRLAAKAIINPSGQITVTNDQYALDDPANNSYVMYYQTKTFLEKQRIWAVEIPLTFQFEHKFGGRHGIYAGLGAKAFIPFNARTEFRKGDEVETSGSDDYLNIVYPSSIVGHFGKYPVQSKASPAKMRISVDLQADFGGVFGVARKVDLYLGLYCSYGFMDILPKEKTDFVKFEPFAADKLTVNGLTGSNAIEQYNTANDKSLKTKWNLFQVGVKFGVHLKPCGGSDKEGEESMKDLQRRFMEEMIKKSNEPIIVKTTEYVYIVPTCPNQEELEGKSKETKDNIKALAEALSSTKILFDLDKDIPKINDNNDNINKTVDILKKDRSIRIVIEGYTCDLGTEQHNRDLAQRRAIAIRNLFINKGVSPDQIEIAAYTINDPENRRNIPDASREEHRAAIFRIITK